jgi:hypothetical protein
MIGSLRAAESGTRERALYDSFQIAKRISEASSVFVRESERFPLTGRGDVNTYALFAELFASLTGQRGVGGVIVPTGIATDVTTSVFFSNLVHGRRLSRLASFENEEFVFPDVHHSFRFCLLAFGPPHDTDGEFCFFLRKVSQLGERERCFTLSAAQIDRINPNTKTAPIFRSRADAALTAKIYSRVPVLIRETDGTGSNPWRFHIHTRLWHMAEDSEWFRSSTELAAGGYERVGAKWIKQCSTQPALAEGAKINPPDEYVPLYEAKMIHHFDHRWASCGKEEGNEVTADEKLDPSFEALPRYWVPGSEVEQRLAQLGWKNRWLMGWRAITSSHVLRTMIADVIPRVGVGHSMSLFFVNLDDCRLAVAFLGCLNSLVLDYVARLKVGGMNLNFFVIKQLPMLAPDAYKEADLQFIVPRIIELTYTSYSLAPFAEDLGYRKGPFVWNEDRRALLRAELDAWYARAYGLTRDELRYVLDPSDVMGEDYPSETFRVLKNNEIKKFGEYRTRRLVLAAWDRLAQAETPQAEPAVAPASVSTTLLPDGAWIMANFDSDAVTAQLAAILKKLPGPTPAERVRLLAIYALYPHYLAPLLRRKEQGEWQRLTGSRWHVNTNVVGFAPKTSVEWRSAYTQLVGMRALMEGPSTDTWAAGAAAYKYRTVGWPDGRAGFVMKALEEIGIDTAITELPADVQVWVKEYAA